MTIIVLVLIFSLLLILSVKWQEKKDKIEIDNVHKLNDEIDKQNKLLENKYHSLKEQYNIQQVEINNLNSRKVEILNRLDSLKQEENKVLAHIDDLTKSATNIYNEKVAADEKAYENYKQVLSQKYSEAEQEYKDLEKLLEKAYGDHQAKLISEQETIKYNLEKIKASQEAMIQAQIREKEIREKISFYCLQLSDEDKSDIEQLERLKKTFHKPRVISMLIWQTYFQKPLKMKAAAILGVGNTNKIVTGIYKITNIETNECYIGQATDTATRWSEHAKCGLGIDTPAANKLYKAMQEYGLCSFSWELLEECPASQLNEKERYYIDFYNSCNYGYNSSKGVSTVIKK